MNIKQNLLAENDILTPEVGLRLQQREGGIRLELALVGKTAEEALEEALSTIHKIKLSYSSMKKQGFGFHEAEIIESSTQTEPSNDRSRVKRLEADFQKHFEKHFVNGKMIQIDENCSFCEGISKRMENAAFSSDSHQSHKNTRNGKVQ